MYELMQTLFLQSDHTLNWNAMATIGSIVSSLLVVFTLLEMKIQRKHSYKPMLLLPDIRFYLQTNSYAVPAIIKESQEEVDNFNIPQPYVDIGNVGLATAINIECTWNIDFEKTIQIIHEVGALLERISFFDSLHGQTVLYRSPLVDIGHSFQMPRLSESYRIAYIKSDGIWKMWVPEILKTIICLYAALKNEYEMMNDKSSYNRYELNIPGEFVVTYRDIAGGKYTNRFKINAFFVKKEPILERTKTFSSVQISFLK